MLVGMQEEGSARPYQEKLARQRANRDRKREQRENKWADYDRWKAQGLLPSQRRVDVVTRPADPATEEMLRRWQAGEPQVLDRLTNADHEGSR